MAGMLFAGSIVTTLFAIDSTWGLGAHYEMMAIARNLASGQGFANPYESLKTGATALCSPLYPALIAVLIKVFGYTSSFGFAVYGFNILIRCCAIVLMPMMSSLLLGTPTPGRIGAFIAALTPLVGFYPQFETAVAWLLIELVIITILQKRRWLAGILLGGLVLANPMAAVALAGSICFITRARKRMIVSGVIAAVICTPWIVRNFISLHSLIPVRDGLGLELFLSNNDCAGPTHDDLMAAGCFESYHPDRNIAMARAIKERGEDQYFRELFHRALIWIRQNPRSFAVLTAERLGLYWLPIRPRKLGSYVCLIVTIISIPGIWLTWRCKRDVALFLVGLMTSNGTVYYFVQSDPRYRAPLMWISALLAGVTIQVCRAAVADHIRQQLAGRNGMNRARLSMRIVGGYLSAEQHVAQLGGAQQCRK
jgi:hypothetical protein